MDFLKVEGMPFIGFTKEEIVKIKRYLNKNHVEILSFGIVQDIADLIGADIGTAITPSGISILKMSLEGAEEIRKENN
ncbi:hypothetical protein [Frisingicoccus sp.]|uniref:hypothetical protein n=1 Tax=Frisingicoccus sp. TaxID=1918627 RepID=UPI003AB4CABE